MHRSLASRLPSSETLAAEPWPRHPGQARIVDPPEHRRPAPMDPQKRETQPPAPGRERRRHPRASGDWPVTVELPDGPHQARVRDPRCGAVVSFVGTTRDTHRGKRVLRLEYEAFEAMTGPEMARIFEDVRARCGSVEGGEPRMLCVHRVGTVGVGEPSVAIVVATPHRDDAFSLARGLIDTLKERLPIWKREVLEDGSHWVGERS